MSKIRKALVSGAVAGGIAAGTYITQASKVDVETIAQAAGAFVVAFVLAGYATWQTPNAK